jgi:hypothetical protein
MPSKSYQTLGWKSRRLTLLLSATDWTALTDMASRYHRSLTDEVEVLLSDYVRSLEQKGDVARDPYPAETSLGFQGRDGA